MAKKSFDMAEYSIYLVGLSVFCAILAGVGALGLDIYLASTQWLLVSLFFVALGIYARLSA